MFGPDIRISTVNPLKDLTYSQIDGLFSFSHRVHTDERGSFRKIFSAATFKSNEITSKLSQVNISLTVESGTVRGMHYQVSPHAESKLVTCTKGKVFDVVLDVRQGSPTFLHHEIYHLEEYNSVTIHIPPGCAHGYQVIDGPAQLVYLHSEEYVIESERGLHVQDPILNITWPLPIRNMSKRDTSHKYLNTDFRGIQI